MNLSERLLADMKSAMKAKDAERLDALRLLKSAIQRQEIDNQRELTDEECIAVLSKQIKQGKESMQQFSDAGREELMLREQKQVEILSTYLPEQMDESAISQAIDDAIAQTGASAMSDMGQVMSALASLKGQADMALVSKLVRGKLS